MVGEILFFVLLLIAIFSLCIIVIGDISIREENKSLKNQNEKYRDTLTSLRMTSRRIDTLDNAVDSLIDMQNEAKEALK